MQMTMRSAASSSTGCGSVPLSPSRSMDTISSSASAVARFFSRVVNSGRPCRRSTSFDSAPAMTPPKKKSPLSSSVLQAMEERNNLVGSYGSASSEQ